MRAHEIIDRYVDPETIAEDVRQELADALARQKPGLTPREKAIMYGDPEAELRLEKLRLDNMQAKAKIVQTLATAASDLADARQ